MGNQKSKGYRSLDSSLKIATEYQIQEYHYEYKKYQVYGNSVKEVMGKLEETCQYHGIPKPKIIPGKENYDYIEGKYHCGTIEILKMFSLITHYNPVFCNSRNGRYTLYVYYLPL